MPDQPTAPNGRPLDHTAPPGHWRSAHRVHGWCSACPGIELWEELVAWRLRADNRRNDTPTHTGTEAAMADPQDENPETIGPDAVTANRLPDQECPECGRAALAVIAVTGVLGGQERTFGGWAWCQGCGATPHPTLAEARRD